MQTHSMAMNEWKSIYMLYKMPIHVLVYKVGRRTCVLLSLFPLLFYPGLYKRRNWYRCWAFSAQGMWWVWVQESVRCIPPTCDYLHRQIFLQDPPPWLGASWDRWDHQNGSDSRRKPFPPGRAELVWSSVDEVWYRNGWIWWWSQSFWKAVRSCYW